MFNTPIPIYCKTCGTLPLLISLSAESQLVNNDSVSDIGLTSKTLHTLSDNATSQSVLGIIMSSVFGSSCEC